MANYGKSNNDTYTVCEDVADIRALLVSHAAAARAERLAKQGNGNASIEQFSDSEGEGRGGGDYPIEKKSYNNGSKKAGFNRTLVKPKASSSSTSKSKSGSASKSKTTSTRRR
ncbi:hypothetical protein M5689_022576 [Euphorbia peplus]|nr:hypothetical protein M5689_022576 [Euphorbia peplus]